MRVISSCKATDGKSDILTGDSHSGGYGGPYFFLAIVGVKQNDPGDKLQAVHMLHLLKVFPIPAANLSSLFIEGEALHGKQSLGKDIVKTESSDDHSLSPSGKFIRFTIS
jgi:hypothetical protein